MIGDLYDKFHGFRGLVGQFAGNLGFYLEMPGFLVDFPFIHFWDCGMWIYQGGL